MLKALTFLRFSWFILENVDIDDKQKDNNLDYILKALSDLGFSVQAYMLISSDYGCPQRRVRLYFVGVRKLQFPQFRFETVLSYLKLFHLKCQPPVARFHFRYCFYEQSKARVKRLSQSQESRVNSQSVRRNMYYVPERH